MDVSKPMPLQSLLVLLALLCTHLVALYLGGVSWHSLGYGCPIPSLHFEPLYSTTTLSSQLNLTLSELLRTQHELAAVKLKLSSLLESALINSSAIQLTRQDLRSASDALLEWKSFSDQIQSKSKELQEYISLRDLPLGWNARMASGKMGSPIGHLCAMSGKDLAKFMEYEVGEECPDDQALAHRLLVHGCEPLPRRRCFARMPPNFPEPLPLPDCLWTVPSDDSILWTPYTCKSFNCLNDRKKKKVFEDCIDCFELDGREKNRWIAITSSHDRGLDLSIDEVLELKRGRIRIGLDIGGGGGTFAVRMREKNVTIVTSSLNLNGPFNNFIALRGVVPLFITIAQRLPFFDNTLDIVHSMHVLSNWIPSETLEFLLFDVDRVLRPGGLLWLDHFFAFRPQMDEIYVPMIEKLGYNKLKWAMAPKLDRGASLQEMYLSALLEKPVSRRAPSN